MYILSLLLFSSSLNANITINSDHQKYDLIKWISENNFAFDAIVFSLIVALFLLIRYKNKILSYKEHELSDVLGLLKQQESALNEHSIVSITDTSGKITYINDKFIEVSGYTKDELVGKNHRLLNSAQHDSKFWNKMYQQLQSGKVWKNSNICNLRKDGSTYWVDTVIVPFIKDEKVESYVAIRTDISESKEVEFELEKLYEEAQTLIKEKESLFQEVQRLAYTDSLTTIPNRLSVMESFQKMLFLAQKESLTLTVMFLDLDGFKLINDTLNHEAGDRVLKDVAEILRNILKEDELYGRLGGDEFIIISLQTTQENTIITLCQELLEKINKIELPQNLQKSFGASIGVIYTKVSQETEIEFLLKKADNLMYEVKKKEKNNFLIQEVS